LIVNKSNCCCYVNNEKLSVSSYGSCMGGVKQPTGRQLLTNFIIYYCIEYTSSWSGFELTTLVIDSDCTGSCKSNYHTIATKTNPFKLIQLSSTYYSQIYHILTLIDCFAQRNKLKMTLYRSLTLVVFSNLILPCSDSIWAGKLHWPDTFCYILSLN
jgi:hypothetical protein